MIHREESYVVSHGKCPECAAIGKDKSGDNLATYSDGHQYCFSCGYYKGGTLVYTTDGKDRTPQPKAKDYSIPEDASPDLPFEAKNWLVDQYHFRMQDIIDNVILWSDKLKWLIFPIEINTSFCGFQARNFNKDKPYKWFTKFPKGNLIKLYNHGTSKSLVIVEDIISAIRVGNSFPCMPLFGSTINDKVLTALYCMGYDKLIFWLDADKFKEMINFSKRSKELGFESRVVFTEYDPKCYPDVQIQQYIQGAR